MSNTLLTFNGEFIICGIVGVAGPLAFKQEKAFQQMLIFDSVRGIDSTGIAAIGRGQQECIVSKAVGNPFELLEMPKTEKIFKRMNMVLIGHNRWSTVGESTRKNAHPFLFDGLVGVHNGTLTNKYQLEDSTNFKVDSEALYNHMDKHGVRAVLDIIQGAWSLVWYDFNKHTLNFLRNKERPMFLAWDTEGKNLFWASEKWMMYIGAQRNELTINDGFATEVDMHYEFAVAPDGTISAPTVTPMAAKIPLYQGAGAWYNGQQHQQSTKPDNVSITPTGKVVVFPKKEEAKNDGVAPSLAVSGVNLEYSNKKDVLLKVMDEGVDEYGAKYVMCFDAEHPGYKIRLFMNKKDNIEALIGCEIIADIGKFYRARTGSCYFKVDYNTVRRKQRVTQTPEDEEENGPLFQNSMGRFVSKEEWLEGHSDCQWCSSAVDPANGYKFTTSGDLMCIVCAHDPEVQSYVSVRS